MRCYIVVNWVGTVVGVNTPLFAYHSARSEKARIARELGPMLRVFLGATVVICLIGGGICLVLGNPLGWVFIGLSALPAMVIEWYENELRELPVVVKGSRIDDVLAANILGLLPVHATPYDVATIIGQVPEGQFFSVRFGIGPLLLQEIASKDSNDMDALWSKALELKKQRGCSDISAGLLIMSLLSLYPGYQQLLAHLQLELEDVQNGIDWYEHIETLIVSSKRFRKTGGLARDWSFGWIPNLSRFGQNISEQVKGGMFSADIASHEDIVGQLMTALSTDGGGVVSLIGHQGVGKSQIVYSLAEKLLDGEAGVPESLRYRQIFMLDAGSLLTAAPGAGELEGLVTTIMSEAYQAKNIIIFLDNAELFFEQGVGSVDLTSALLPILQAARLPMIVALDEQRFLQISRRSSALTNALRRINVKPLNISDTMSVMQNHLVVSEFRQKVTYMYQALAETYRLSERYVHDLEMPGRAVKLLDDAARYAESGLVTAQVVHNTVEQTLDVKVGAVRDDAERDTLLHLEDRIHERMINQVRAVSVVSDALRRARAGVRDQDRPIGTFLFLGPTGVGKTELAKALASVFFGGEDRIIRLDLNEFVRSEDVVRLIADGADDPSSLTARVMKQPFSVILLDEIEKAHPAVLATFLQVLDEGILKDVRNRDVIFKDAIIIATSNAGADRIREQIGRGLAIENFEDQFVDELISSGEFKPEFLNRFDEIVMFTPLKKPELLQVVDLIIAGVNKTLEQQKVSVTVSDEAKQYLVEAGYDPRLGARPMRRVVQRAVENTVAKQLLAGDVEAGGTVAIDLAQVQALVSLKKQADKIINESV